MISRKMTAAFTEHSPASIRKSSTHSADNGSSFPLRQQLCGSPSSGHLNQGSCVYGCHGDVSASPKKALSPGRGSLGAQERLGRQDGLVGWYRIGRSHSAESREPRAGGFAPVWPSLLCVVFKRQQMWLQRAQKKMLGDSFLFILPVLQDLNKTLVESRVSSCS